MNLLYTPEQPQQIWCPDEFDLSGSDVRVPILCSSQLDALWGNSQPSYSIIIKNIIVTYTEAMPASLDATYDNIIRIGHEDNTSAYEDFTPTANAAIADIDVVDNSDVTGDRVLLSKNWLLVRCKGGASGTGKVRVGLTISFNAKDYSGFTV